MNVSCATNASWNLPIKPFYVQPKERGAYGIRTRDLLNAIEALYQLS